MGYFKANRGCRLFEMETGSTTYCGETEGGMKGALEIYG